MTNNEKIAEWRGYTRFKTPATSQKYPGVPAESWIKPSTGLTASIEFDGDIVLWHGKDGLLAEIEQREKKGVFLDALMVANAWAVDGRWNQDFVWLICRATPAQLAAALMRMMHTRTYGGSPLVTVDKG